MDEFVCSFLRKWGYGSLIEKFKDEEVDKESFLSLGEGINEDELKQLIPKAGARLKFKKLLRQLTDGAENGQKELGCGATVPLLQEEPAEMSPESTSGASRMSPEDFSSSGTTCEHEENVTKRKLGPQPETDTPAKLKRQCDTAPGSFEDDFIQNQVIEIMLRVHNVLGDHESTELNNFLKNKIRDLNTDKRDLVGVFGKTGGGKSTLINAIIEEKDLLPTGGLRACTTAMIKVEANTQSNKYEAEIEFISKEEWKDELWSLKNLFGEISEDKKDCGENIEKMTALYGDEWKYRSPENLMEPKYFKEIPEFLKSGKKIVQVESAQELAQKVLKYTRSNSDEGKRWFWPLVKCVTVKVPNNNLLKHITLVDLPGNGDRNKSRDQMWKEVVASCSTVWIVSDMNRAVSDRDAWEILESTCSLMGNGGECQNINFICTKSDEGADDDGTPDSIARNILKNNQEAKDLIRKEFNKLSKVKKQFKDECFEVFTVSSREFFQKKNLEPDETEIPKLQEWLRSLNDQHDITLNYVFGAYGILSLIQGTKLENVPGQTAQVCEKLNGNIKSELQKVKRSMDDMYEEFKKCLRKGVEESKNKSEMALKRKLNPTTKGGGRGFHRQLKCALQNDGLYETKKKQINLNETLSTFLTDSIDEEFRKTFPNDAISGPIYGKIHAFSLDMKELVQQFKNLELQLTFIKTEVAKVKIKLCKDIRDRKKIIYNSLTETVKETMQECYEKAADFSGLGSLEKMKDTVKNHLHDVKDTMFKKARAVMLAQLKELMDDVQKQLEKTLQESIELSFKTKDLSIPDFGGQFNLVKKHFDDLMGQNKEDLTWPDLLD